MLSGSPSLRVTFLLLIVMPVLVADRGADLGKVFARFFPHALILDGIREGDALALLSLLAEADPREEALLPSGAQKLFSPNRQGRRLSELIMGFERELAALPREERQRVVAAFRDYLLPQVSDIAAVEMGAPSGWRRVKKALEAHSESDEG